MGKKYLIVIDMQNDFVSGSLGSEEAQKIVPKVIAKATNFVGTVIFTQDTHQSNYLSTQEGKLLPIEHCIEGSDGWQLIDGLKEFQKNRNCKSYKKDRFGSTQLAEDLRLEYQQGNISSIELIGVCTDICVVSNALLLKAYIPELPLSIDADCCAGVTPLKHQAAIETMKSCQIDVKNG